MVRLRNLWVPPFGTEWRSREYRKRGDQKPGGSDAIEVPFFVTLPPPAGRVKLK
jgi:hypothetical protein